MRIGVIENARMTSPVMAGMILFGLIYISKCSNHSHLDGIRHFDEGNYTKALKCYNEYLTLHPHHLQTLYNRARCYDILGQHENAEIDYLQVIERQRDHVNALLGLSQIYYFREDYKGALGFTRQATLNEPENYLAQYYHGRACHKLGMLSDALDAYNMCIDLNPDYGFAYFHRSSVMLSFGLLPFGCYDLKTAVLLHVEGAEDAYEKYCAGVKGVSLLE